MHTDRRSSLHSPPPHTLAPWIPYRPDTLLSTPPHFPSPRKGPGTKDTLIPPWTDRHLWKHYLPATSFAVCHITRKLQERKGTQKARILLVMTPVVLDHLCLFTSASCFIWSPTEATKSLFAPGESEHKSNAFLWYLLSFSMKGTLIPKTLSEGGIVFAQCKHTSLCFKLNVLSAQCLYVYL